MTDVSIIAAYLIITLLVGIYKGRNIKTMRDFSIADRCYPTSVLVATIAATLIGGWALMGITEKVVSTGIIFVLIFFGVSTGKLLIAQFIAPRMSRYQNMISIGDIMEFHYGKSGKIATGIAGTLFGIGIIGAQIGAIGYFCQTFMNIPQVWGVLLGCGIVVIYSAFGGIKAVTATDVIQFGVLIIAIPMICNAGLNQIGGYRALFEAVPASTFKLFPDGHNPLKFVMMFFIFGVQFFDAGIVQRLLMARDCSQIRTSMRISSLIDVPFFLIAGTLGLLAMALTPDVDPNLALPSLINTVLPTGIKGFVLAGMLAVVMSTADSYLNATCITFVHDVVKPLTKRDQLSDAGELRLAQLTTLVVGTASMMAALLIPQVMDIVLVFINFWVPVALVPFVAAVLGYRAQTRSLMMAIVAGLSMVAFWSLFMEDMTGIDGTMPGLLANSFVFFITSLSYNRKMIDQDKQVQEQKKRKPEFATV